MDRVDCLVVGAGVVGLACARALAQAGLEVVVAEREPIFGSGVSARNSEVIHAGLYNPPGSLKSTLCVRGKSMLYDFCAARGVEHRRSGKLIVATRLQDTEALEAIASRARSNGVDDLQWLTHAQAGAMEPALECAAALWSPSSGIVDSHALMTALLGEAESAGALIAVTSRFVAATRRGAAWQVRAQAGPGEPDFEMEAGWLVNAAGLDAQAVAATIDGFSASAIPARHLAKGHYFSLGGRSPFSRLIYPTPVDGGLGVHLTLDLAGQARFGPDVEWLDSNAGGADLDYTVDPRRAVAFAAEVRRYWPGLPDGAIAPAYSGIRPKLAGPGQALADFRIDGPAQHGCAGVVQLFGIESPGLTACLAIGELVASIVAQTAQ
ncbi:MAG: NAD(P)/FAD-dependent oxidoreductase [Burkholderiaceae bacterium]